MVCQKANQNSCSMASSNSSHTSVFASATAGTALPLACWSRSAASGVTCSHSSVHPTHQSRWFNSPVSLRMLLKLCKRWESKFSRTRAPARGSQCTLGMAGLSHLSRAQCHCRKMHVHLQKSTKYVTTKALPVTDLHIGGQAHELLPGWYFTWPPAPNNDIYDEKKNNYAKIFISNVSFHN